MGLTILDIHLFRGPQLYINNYTMHINEIYHLKAGIFLFMLQRLFVNKRQRKPKGQSIMDNPQSRETGNIGYTKHKTKTKNKQTRGSVG